MKWQRSTRTLYLSVLGLEIATLWGLWQAAEFSHRRETIATETRALIDPLFPAELQRLDEGSPFLIALYDQDSAWPVDFHVFKRRFLRRRMSLFLGLDADELERLALAGKEPECGSSPVERYVNGRWPIFQQTWLNDLYSSGEFLEGYLEEPSRENVLGAQTSHDERFAQLPLISEMLKEAGDELRACAGQAEQEQRNERDGLEANENRANNAMWCGALQGVVEEHGTLLSQYYEVRKRVDALAFMDDHLAEQGLLLYGSNHRLAPEIEKVEPVKVLGLSIAVAGNWAWWLVAVNLVALTFLLRVLHVSRRETFGRDDVDAEGWFALALPVWLRVTLLLVIPVVGFLLLVVLSLRF